MSVFPTCFIEYMEPAIGQDLVKVYERNGVSCSLPEGTSCCGAPWLHQGNVKEFTKAAERNVAALAAEVRAGRDVVVAQPTCAYVVRKDYPLYLEHTALGADAALVAEHTSDPAEYLMALHKGEGTELATDFIGRDTGAVPDQVTYHVACHLQAQHIGLKSRDLLKVAGVKATLVQRCSGIDGTWGYRAENYELARKVAAPMAKEVRAAGNDVVCGDCHLANGAIEQETGTRPVHPMQLMARAYGIPEEETMTARPLTLDDIADQRAYERERDAFRRDVIAHKKLRRVTVGPVVTLTFESRMTMRFQVQEMARAERMTTDEQIQHELDVYNRLLPVPGRAVGDPVPRADDRGGPADVAAPAGGHRAVGGARDRWGPARRRRPLGPRPGARVAADPRGGHLGGPLRALPVHPGRGGGLRGGSGDPGGRPPRLPRRAPRRRAVGRHPRRAVPGPGRGVVPPGTSAPPPV